MNKFLFIFITILILYAPSARAQYAIDAYTNAYEINIIPGAAPVAGKGPAEREMNKCQATRLNKEWFLTAAHCLQDSCSAMTGGCALQARLLVGPGWEVVIQTHAASTYDEAIRIYAPQSADKNNIAFDVALIRFAADKYKYIYLNGNISVPEDIFMDTTPLSGIVLKNAKDGANFPTLIALDTQTAKIFNRPLFVPSIWGGRRELLISHDTVFYSPKKQYLFTDNFGIRGGISGSGVFISPTELVGITSATGSLRQIYAGGENPLNLTFLTAFNEDVIKFITYHVGNIKSRTADMTYFKVIPEDLRPSAFAVEDAIS